MSPDLSPEHLADAAFAQTQHEGRPPFASEEEFVTYWLANQLGEELRLGNITREDAQALLEAGWLELQRRLSPV